MLSQQLEVGRLTQVSDGFQALAIKAASFASLLLVFVPLGNNKPRGTIISHIPINQSLSYISD